MSMILGALAIVGLVASILAVWARGVLFDSEKVGQAVEQALEEPEVTQGLAAQLADSVFVAGDVEASVVNVLPSALDHYGEAMVNGVHDHIEHAFEKVLEAKATRKLAVSAAEKSHREVMRLLEGKGIADGVSVEDGSITLNTLPLLDRGFLEVQNLGLMKKVNLPKLSADGDPQAQIRQLEEAFDRQLPDDFGQLVVFSGDAVDNAQTTVALAQKALVLVKRSIVMILFVTVAAAAGSLASARTRPRALLNLLLGACTAMLLARLLVQQVVERAPMAVASPSGRAAISAMVVDVSSGLLGAFALVLILGVAAAIAAYFASPGTAGNTAIRSNGTRAGRLAGLAREHREAAILASFAVAMVVLLGFGLGLGQFLIGTSAAAFGLWVWSTPTKGATSMGFAPASGQAEDSVGDMPQNDDEWAVSAYRHGS
jgi:hypothetical protein